MTRYAVIPLKGLSNAKSRLQHALSGSERAKLVISMAQHVIDTVSAVADVTCLATPEHRTEFKQVLEVKDAGEGLNMALRTAWDALSPQSSDICLSINADLPHLTREEVERMFALSEADNVVIAPDMLRVGTNAIAVRNPATFKFSFGESSFLRHVSASHNSGRQSVICDSHGLALDIDETPDLNILTAHYRR